MPRNVLLFNFDHSFNGSSEHSSSNYHSSEIDIFLVIFLALKTFFNSISICVLSLVQFSLLSWDFEHYFHEFL